LQPLQICSAACHLNRGKVCNTATVKLPQLKLPPPISCSWKNKSRSSSETLRIERSDCCKKPPCPAAPACRQNILTPDSAIVQVVLHPVWPLSQDFHVHPPIGPELHRLSAPNGSSHVDAVVCSLDMTDHVICLQVCQVSSTFVKHKRRFHAYGFWRIDSHLKASLMEFVVARR